MNPDGAAETRRVILHVDMDAFYASVEQLDHPEYRGRPVIVGADPKDGKGRGVVAACSYEARRFGIRSALPIGRAWKLCPDGVYVRPRMQRYVAVSAQVMSVLGRFTDLVEPLSIDEAFLDVSGSIALFGDAERIGRAIKTQIFEATGLHASVGAGPNKFIAKIASDLRKPNALVIVPDDAVDDFLRELPISRLWGVGPKTEARLQKMGFRTIGDIRKTPREDLVRAMGSLGEHLHRLSLGKDDRPVIAHWEAKSVSSETTFEEDTGDRELLVRTIRQLAGAVGRRLRRDGQRARRITLKLRYADFETHTRQTSLDHAVQADDRIAETAVALFAHFPLDRKVRLIGVAAGDIQHPGSGPAQLSLFEGAEASARKDSIDDTLDRVREKFGDASLRRGSQLLKR